MKKDLSARIQIFVYTINMKSLYEGILAGMDDTMAQGDAFVDLMHLFHWRFGKSYKYKVYKVVSGGLGGVFKKHFTPKPVTIHTRWTASPIAKHLDDSHQYSHTKYGIDYLYAIILNTKLPRSADNYNLHDRDDIKEIKDAIEENLRFYMTDDWRKFRTQKEGFPVLTVVWHRNTRSVTLKIYYHSNDTKYESQLLCDLEFNINE